ncbi:hypothetical protein LLEC1_04323 [Akanthomyces lecanii]|uniref:Gfo/Idh/MocA-like oxidoreductase N-terminal domain-containing protein n=1 Tax=Cordyceps confragosa TaxID=2714763 RepID=A0A179IF46_CORDF|nr:hypothetical protein LLEC1_04323 [Akanthomyces lecanii]
MASKSFNVGVIGYGMSAKIFHIPFIATTPQFKLHAIVQRSPKDGNSAPADHPEAKHYTDVQDLLADAAVDVVVVTTPPDNHFALTKAALEAGKHVLTEKPFVPTSAEADQLIAVARAHGRLICVYQNRRWDSDFLTPRFWVRGLKGSFHKVGLDPQEDQLKAGVKPTAEGFGKDKPESMRLSVVDAQGKSSLIAVPDLKPETYTTFYNAFGRAVETGKEEDVPVKPTEARDVLRIIEAIQESAKSGKDVTF